MSERLRILIANEKRERLMLLADVLTQLGHEVIATETEVVEVAAATVRELPDIAIVGLGASAQHALDLIGEIVHEAACPVIALLSTGLARLPSTRSISTNDPAYIQAAAKRGIFASVFLTIPTTYATRSKSHSAASRTTTTCKRRSPGHRRQTPPPDREHRRSTTRTCPPPEEI